MTPKKGDYIELKGVSDSELNKVFTKWVAWDFDNNIGMMSTAEYATYNYVGVNFLGEIKLVKAYSELATSVRMVTVAEVLGESTKQPRYTSDNGKDLIDRWAETRTPDEFRVIMWAMIEKYETRLGKKDCIAQEVGKIADYAKRWHEYEMNLPSFTKEQAM